MPDEGKADTQHQEDGTATICGQELGVWAPHGPVRIPGRAGRAEGPRQPRAEGQGHESYFGTASNPPHTTKYHTFIWLRAPATRRWVWGLAHGTFQSSVPPSKECAAQSPVWLRGRPLAQGPPAHPSGVPIRILLEGVHYQGSRRLLGVTNILGPMSNEAILTPEPHSMRGTLYCG